jgi:hypothetical protein
MRTTEYLFRFVIGSALLCFTLWLFGNVWTESSLASDNIVNAVEASIPDTVIQSTWLQITLGTLGLVAAFSSLASAIPLRVLSMFRWWEKPLVFGAPLALIAMSPLIGAPTPLASCAVIIVCVMLRREKFAKVRSNQLKQDA